MIEKKNYEETLVDKDNHSWDDFKYFINKIFRKAVFPEEKVNPNSPYGRLMEKQKARSAFIYGN
jgi:hypothetical protein